jgi:hypothetical protein
LIDSIHRGRNDDVSSVRKIDHVVLPQAVGVVAYRRCPASTGGPALGIERVIPAMRIK